MIWSCAELIYFFSLNFTLRPGMVIITGTPAGTAWSSDRELGGKGITQPGLVAATRYCLPGDVIECEIERIGTLRNRVVGAEAASRIRRRPQAASHRYRLGRHRNGSSQIPDRGARAAARLDPTGRVPSTGAGASLAHAQHHHDRGIPARRAGRSRGAPGRGGAREDPRPLGRSSTTAPAPAA